MALLIGSNGFVESKKRRVIINYVPGLEGVVVGETAISHVEGDIGRLSYRGRVIEDIVGMDYLG